MRLQTQQLLEVVGADFHRRLAHLVAGLGHGVAAPLDDQHVQARQALAQLQRQREAGQAAAHDDDVMVAGLGECFCG